MTAMRETQLLGVMGTGSDVGKSLIVAGLARQLARSGVSVVPFKAQNMASNAAPALMADASGGWGEIGRAQAVQAAAANVLPSVLMNPILLKPIDGQMRVHVDGKVVAHEDWRAYRQRTADCADLIDKRLTELVAGHQAEVCLIEGAGSCVELNLIDQDVANLPLLNRHQAPWVLVGDIDRGGIYAQVLGVQACLPPSVWQRCVGVVVNRLRGDPAFFQQGQEDIAQRIGKPVYVIPHLEAHGLPDEDTFHLRQQQRFGSGQFTACVVQLPHLAMSDDVEPIANDPLWRSIDWCATPPPQQPDAVIIPGSTDSLADARFLQQSSWPRQLRQWAAAGVPIVGCVAVTTCWDSQLLIRWRLMVLVASVMD